MNKTRKLLKNIVISLVTLVMVCSIAGCTDAKEKVSELVGVDAVSENKMKESTDTSETIEDDSEMKNDTVTTVETDAADTTEEIGNAAETPEEKVMLESGGNATGVSESEWKNAYVGLLKSVQEKYTYVFGYIYDFDGNGIPELIVSDFGKHNGESYTYTKDGMISLGNYASEFSHLYYYKGCLINRASSGGSPGPIWITIWKFDGVDVQTICELEFDYRLGDDGKPEVTGAENYDEAAGIVESYGMSVDFTEIQYDGETYCQVNVDTSGIESIMSYDDENFVTAVEDY